MRVRVRGRARVRVRVRVRVRARLGLAWLHAMCWCVSLSSCNEVFVASAVASASTPRLLMVFDSRLREVSTQPGAASTWLGLG